MAGQTEEETRGGSGGLKPCGLCSGQDSLLGRKWAEKGSALGGGLATHMVQGAEAWIWGKRKDGVGRGDTCYEMGGGKA